MIKAFADGVQFYDSRIDSTRPLAFKATPSVVAAGTAEILLPPGHPAYESFVDYRTLVEIYRQDTLIFRGRAFCKTDNLFRCRTVTFEGERSFFRDSVMRPYLYQATPAEIFTDIINQHNSQVEAFKGFEVGTITVTDANDYVRFESESAEQTSDTLNKLLERCGGYIVFTTSLGGKRRVSWLEKLEYLSGQSIELGENLLDFSRSGVPTNLATRIIPYGAKDEETGKRITVESVNNGLDYVEDEDAVALRSTVALPVFWDDVTDPENLLRKAKEYLAASKMVVSTLSLTAVDLSALDQNIDTFQVGDQVRVVSKPHGLDDIFLLRERTYDLLNPANDTVTLGKDLTTLTGETSAAHKDSLSQLHRTEHNIRADYTLNIQQAMAATELLLTSLIEQTSEMLRMEVSETYTTNGELESRLSTVFTQLKDSFEMEFNSLRQTVDGNDAESREQFEIIRKYIRFEDGNILLGVEGNSLNLRMEHDRIGFYDGGAEVAYFSNKQLYVLDGHFLNSLRLGKFAFIPRENGNLSLVKVGS